ncbi:arylsulfatase [Sphingomonas montanisoli]|uniref:Arylsulfatase n=1 Tax=Sphingomonas montanisoli TaxID=2606412 RepID=A0A5D9C725_9SPHN|nr:arylsulfatase [Sphingomonas montanisoli]TZG25815.1 arylsulfatase [Sphingomonas montanisoli]
MRHIELEVQLGGMQERDVSKGNCRGLSVSLTVITLLLGSTPTLLKATGPLTPSVGKPVFPPAGDFAPKWPQQPRPAANAPNILLIMLDDEGFGASSSFGGLVPTPNFDRLARQGARYNNFNTTGMCSPSRASLLTGRYPHNAAMGALSDLAAGYDGYSSVIPKSTSTIAQVLKEHGYGTAMFGKAHFTPPWELTAAGPFDRWPTGLGFEHFYGFLQGDTNQYAPNLVVDNRYVTPPVDPDYFFEKDIADQTIRWIDEQNHADPAKPFFIYYAPGATHAPHHAPADWIARFKGQFDDGWDEVRARIFARQRAAGIIPASTRLTPRPAELPAWDSLSSDQKQVAARFMEAYAAQLSYVDAQIGRLLDTLEKTGKADNTMIILIQGDNGASGEGGVEGTFYEQSLNFSAPESPAYKLANMDKIGGPLSDNMYPAGWAWAMNTPFRWFKQNASHFGAIRNGMTIRWPGHIASTGSVRQQFSHISDIAPTIFEAAGITVPVELNGVRQKPIDGISLAYTFQQPKAPAQRKTQYFEILENVSIYHDGWVAATRPTYMPWQLFSADRPKVSFNDREWQLYNVANDFSEYRDLSAQQPERLHALQTLFLDEAKKNNVLPIHDLGEGGAGRPGLATRSTYTYAADTANVHVSAAPPLGGKAYSIDVDALLSDTGRNGVMVAQGGRFSGFSFYLKDGVPTFAYNAIPPRVFTVQANRALSPGEHHVIVRFEPDGGKEGSGTLRFTIDGADAGGGQLPVTLKRFWFTEGLDVGKDLMTPVSPDYEGPNSFPGVIRSVQFRLQ